MRRVGYFFNQCEYQLLHLGEARQVAISTVFHLTVAAFTI